MVVYSFRLFIGLWGSRGFEIRAKFAELENGGPCAQRDQVMKNEQSAINDGPNTMIVMMMTITIMIVVSAAIL